MDRVHFIYLFTSCHLSCFHLEAILNNARRNVHVHVLYTHVYSNLLDIQQGVELPGHLVTPCLAF